MDSFDEWVDQTAEVLFKTTGIYIHEIEIDFLFYFQLDYTPQEIVNIVSQPLDRLLSETVELWLF
jgi:hypothetical protein